MYWPSYDVPQERYCSISCVLAAKLSDRAQSPFLLYDEIRPLCMGFKHMREDHESKDEEKRGVLMVSEELPVPAPDCTLLSHFAENGVDLARFRSLGDYSRLLERQKLKDPLVTAYENSGRPAWASTNLFATPEEVNNTSGFVVAHVRQEFVRLTGMSLQTRADTQQRRRKTAQPMPTNNVRALFNAMLANVRKNLHGDKDESGNDRNLKATGDCQTYVVSGMTIRTRRKVPEDLVTVRSICRVQEYFLCVRLRTCLLKKRPTTTRPTSEVQEYRFFTRERNNTNLQTKTKKERSRDDRACDERCGTAAVLLGVRGGPLRQPKHATRVSVGRRPRQNLQ